MNSLHSLERHLHPVFIVRSILSSGQRNCTCAFDWESYCETTSDTLWKHPSLHSTTSSPPLPSSSTHLHTHARQHSAHALTLSRFGASCSEWNRAARCREAWKNFQKKKHPALQSLVKIDPPRTPTLAPTLDALDSDAVPAEMVTRTSRAESNTAVIVNGTFFARSSHHAVSANSCVRLRGCMTRTTGPCYCDGMFLRRSKHSFVPLTV